VYSFRNEKQILYSGVYLQCKKKTVVYFHEAHQSFSLAHVANGIKKMDDINCNLVLKGMHCGEAESVHCTFHL
jgi:hypothetical protein